MKRLFCSITAVMAFVATSAMAQKAGPADIDSDGKVSKQEFFETRAKLAEKAGKPFDEAASEKMFATRDADKDGFLTGDEVSAAKK